METICLRLLLCLLHAQADPVTLLVHHALADGSHMAMFYDALRAELTVLTGDTPLYIVLR